MALIMDWKNSIINVPKSYMTVIQTAPTEILQLNIMDFKKDLGDILDDPIGMSYPDIFSHNPSVSVGGVILSPVLEILEPYTVTFEDGQYAVNLVGANSNIGDRVNVNQVSIRSANSAGLQDLSTILSSAYQGRVVVDVIKGQSGTVVPIGTLSTPVNNIPDAVEIAKKNGLGEIFIIGNITFDTGDNIEGYIISGQNAVISKITINDGANTLSCEVKNATVTGILDGNSTIKDCVVDGINYVNGSIIHSAFTKKPIVLGGGAEAMLANTYSLVAGAETPIVDMNGSGQQLAVRGHLGGLKIINRTGTDPCSIDMESGHLIIDSTCTNGDIYARGVYYMTDNSNGANVIQYGKALSINNIPDVADGVWSKQL